MSGAGEGAALWARLTARRASRIRIEVPEWGEDGAPCVIYAHPYTAAEEAAIYAHLEHADDPAVWSRVVHQKAEGEGGERLFSHVDYPLFARTVDGLICRTVALQIMAGRVSRETAAGN